FLTPLTPAAAQAAHEATVRAGFAGKAIRVTGFDYSIAESQDPVAGPNAHWAKDDDLIAEGDEHVANATSAFARHHGAMASRAIAKKCRKNSRARIGTPDAFPHSRPAVGRETRRSGSLHPAERRPTVARYVAALEGGMNRSIRRKKTMAVKVRDFSRTN